MFPVFEEIKKLQHADCHQLAFNQAVLGVEFLGALLDDKPIRADKQSSKRFTIAFRKTFPRRYGNPTVVKALYKDVRCNLSHLMIPSNRVFFSNEIENHLKINGATITLNKKQFVNDFLTALQRIETRLQTGELVLKKGLKHPLNNA